mgnify:CR=1 FL=1
MEYWNEDKKVGNSLVHRKDAKDAKLNETYEAEAEGTKSKGLARRSLIPKKH